MVVCDSELLGNIDLQAQKSGYSVTLPANRTIGEWTVILVEPDLFFYRRQKEVDITYNRTTLGRLDIEID